MCFFCQFYSMEDFLGAAILHLQELLLYRNIFHIFNLKNQKPEKNISALGMYFLELKCYSGWFIPSLPSLSKIIFNRKKTILQNYICFCLVFPGGDVSYSSVDRIYTRYYNNTCVSKNDHPPFAINWCAILKWITVA